MKDAKFPKILFILLFFGFLGLMACSTFFLPKNEYSFYENRMLQAKPELTWEALTSGDYFRQLDSYLTDHTGGRETLMKADTKLNLLRNQKLLGMDAFELNQVVVTDRVLLPYMNPISFNEEGVRYNARNLAKNIADARDAVEAYGGTYVFCLVPCQFVTYEEFYPDFMENRSELTRISHEELIKALTELEVVTVDMGATLTDPSIRDLAASKVDNHFTMEGAYLTYLRIMEAINQGRQAPLSVLEEGDYTLTQLPNHYLGSRSRKLFDMSPIREQLSIITPKTEIPFRRFDHGSEVTPTIYSLPVSPEVPVVYGLYMGGDRQETLIDTQRPELPSLLVYGDSFTNVVECLLWNSFNQMRSLDLRYYKDMSLGEYIQSYQPDCVVSIIDYQQMTSGVYNEGPVWP